MLIYWPKCWNYLDQAVRGFVIETPRTATCDQPSPVEAGGGRWYMT